MNESLLVMQKFFYNDGIPLSIPIRFLTPPLEDWMVRELDLEHVKELIRSIQLNPKSLLHGEPGGVLILDEEMSIKNKNGLLTNADILNYLSIIHILYIEIIEEKPYLIYIR